MKNIFSRILLLWLIFISPILLAAPGTVLYQNSFNSNGQLNGDWSRTSGQGNDFQTNNFLFSSSPRSLRIRDGSGGISNSGLINAQVPAAQLTLWVRQHTSGNGPESGEDLQLLYSSDDGASWNLLQTFAGADPYGTTYNVSINLPAAALVSNLRFQLNMTAGTNSDRWYVDDFTVTEIAPDNNPPVANNDNANTQTFGTVNIPLSANDTDVGSGIDVASIVIVSSPANGAVVVNNDGSVDYTHNGGPTSSDSFTYTIRDLFGNISNVATVSVTVQVLTCNTFADDFSSGTLSGDSGSQNFTGPWNVRSVSNGGIGFVNNTNNRMRLQGNNRSNNSATGPYDYLNNWAERDADLSAYTSATLSFDFIAVGALETVDEAILEISSDGGASFTTLQVFNGFTTTTTVPVSYDISSYISTSFNTRIRIRIQEDPNTNACCFGASDEFVDIDNFIITACGAAATVDHFLISHDGQGISCLAEPITVTAHDLGHSVVTGYNGTINLNTGTGKGDWSIISANGVLNNGVANDGVATYAFSSADNGSVQLALDYQEGATPINIAVNDGAITDDDTEGLLNFSPSGFIVTANQLSNPPPNPIVDPILSQTAGTNFNVWITAYGQTATDPVCGVIESYSGVKPVNFWVQYANPVTGTLTPTINTISIASSEAASSPQNINFNNGQASVVVKYKDVGSISLQLKDADLSAHANVIQGASNNFVVKPADFVTSVLGNPAAADANGAVLTRAGNAFTTQVNVVDAEGSITPNYGNEIVPESITTKSAQLVLPLTGRNGSDSLGTLGNDNLYTVTAPGQFQNNQINFDEVGIIRLQSSVADGDYLGAGDVVGSITGNVGRFIPDRFMVSDNSPMLQNGDNSWSCGFSYQSQPIDFATGMNPVITVSAVSEAGTPTFNYGGNFWKLNSSLSNRSYVNQVPAITANLTSDSSTSTVSYSGTADFNDGQGQIDIMGDKLSYNKSGVIPLASDAPFNADAKLQLTVSDLQDSDGVCFDSNNDATCETYLSTDITGTELRWGRWQIDNAQGSELENLSVAATTSYFDGNFFQINTLDTCSASYPGWIAPGLSAYTGNLNAGETTLTQSPMTTGILPMQLSAPGEGNDGSLLITIPTPPWLFYDFDGNGTADAASATVTFGIFNGRKPVIYWRQKFSN